jgi:hypothetical protein
LWRNFFADGYGTSPAYGKPTVKVQKIDRLRYPEYR